MPVSGKGYIDTNWIRLCYHMSMHIVPVRIINVCRFVSVWPAKNRSLVYMCILCMKSLQFILMSEEKSHEIVL